MDSVARYNRRKVERALEFIERAQRELADANAFDVDHIVDALSRATREAQGTVELIDNLDRCRMSDAH